MAKYELRAGAEIDILTPAEHAKRMDKTDKEFRNSLDGEALTGTQQIATDAAGNVGGGVNGPGVTLYEAPAGMTAHLHRVTMSANGFTPILPVSSGWLAWYRGAPSSGSLVMFTPSSGTGVIPFVWSEGRHSAPIFRPGEYLVLSGAGLPASLQVGIAFQFTLRKIV